MSGHFGAVGNQPVAVQAAQEFLLSGGSAVGAVLAGFFSACGAHAGILLGPLSLIVAGVGSGVRAFDGRLRQPGLGTKRPRGFLNDDEVPPAARVAVPQSIAAAVVAHAYDRGGPISEVVKRGVRQAKQVGSQARAEVLQSIRAQGARALSSPGLARPLLHVAGISEGGLVTSADLATVAAIDVAATSHPRANEWMQVPWAAGNDNDGDRPSSDSLPMALAAVDSRGVFAAAAYSWTTNGIVIEELDLEAPPCAMPVMRGITRIAPGCPIPAAAPLAIQVLGGRPIAVACDPRATRLDFRNIEQAPLRIFRDPESRIVKTIP
jgi:hypothetical protein